MIAPRSGRVAVTGLVREHIAQTHDGTLAHRHYSRATVSAAQPAQVDPAPLLDSLQVASVHRLLGGSLVHRRDRVGVLGTRQPDPDRLAPLERLDPILGLRRRPGLLDNAVASLGGADCMLLHPGEWCPSRIRPTWWSAVR